MAADAEMTIQRFSLRRLTSRVSMSDEEAMWRVRSEDDTQAFSVLVRRWEERVWRLCFRITGDAHRAQDLAQEVFIRLFAARERYEPTGRFAVLVRRVAVNLCYDELRRRQRRPESPLDLDDESGRENERCLPGDDPPPDVALVARERKGLVREALAGLPEHYRTVVVLRHYEGLRFREIAELLDIPIGTVKSRMAEALDRLARALGPEMTCDPVRDAIATGRSRV